MRSAAVFELLTRLCPADAIIAVDVGINTYFIGRCFERQRQPVLISGYLDSIGFDFPAAIGAWTATQDFEEFRGRKLVSLSCGGGFARYAMDFTTAAQYGMDVIHVRLNNAQLGKIAKERRAAGMQVWETDLRNPSFSICARQRGGHGVKVSAAAMLDQDIADALPCHGPALVEVMTDAELV